MPMSQHACACAPLRRVEQAYVDAYEGEGWRGANREKVRSTSDLERARLQVRLFRLPCPHACSGSLTPMIWASPSS